MDDERFTGAVCFSMLHHVPSPELQDELFREAARVLRQGAPFVAVDAAWSEGTAAFHEGDTYQPIDPDTLPGRLAAAGFSDVAVQLNEFGWAALARSEEHTSELQSLMRSSYAVFCLKKKTTKSSHHTSLTPPCKRRA